MKVVETAISGVLTIEPSIHKDSRGFFLESWNERAFNAAIGQEVHFVQDNHSHSTKGVLRGLHYQLVQPQGKLVRVPRGRIFDVAVDLRERSNTFGQSVATELSAENQKQLWIPPGFAHGFLALTDNVDVLYKTTDYYHLASEQTLFWNDPVLNIAWPLEGLSVFPQLSAKDQNGRLLKDAQLE